jgi:hypothetical protein
MEEDRHHPTYYHSRLDGGAGGGPRETWEEIQAGRKREEARRYAEAVRIQREQVVRGFEEEKRALRARILALRRECEVRIASVRREWKRAQAIERGEVVMVEEEEEEDSDSDSDGEMDVEYNYAPTETSLTTDNDDDNDNDELWQQWPSRSPPPRSETNIHFALQIESRKIPRQPPPHMGISPSSGMAGPSRLEPEPEAMEEAHRRPRTSLPQPLRRQPAQLMAIPTSSLGLRAYTTGVLDPENRFCGDNDSEMGEAIR